MSRQLKQRMEPLGTAFFVCNSQHFAEFEAEYPEFAGTCAYVLKEWEIVAQARRSRFDPKVIDSFERRLGNPNLWGPLVGDRRLYLGKRATYRQDYRPRFSHEQMLSILQEALLKFDKVFECFRPDVVVTLYPATFGDYLAYLFGKERGALTLDFRLTRIRNYLFAAESILEPSSYLRRRYEQFERGGPDPELLAEARRFLEEVQAGRPIYDGMFLASRKASSPPGPVRKAPLARRLASKIRYWSRGYASDHQIPNPFDQYLYTRILNPRRQHRIQKSLGDRYLSVEALAGLNYAFFPLHTEPEMTLSVYARPFMNQIEVVRLLSHSLPVSWKLVVKEHPATFGRRPLSYYEKLLEIPNVRLVSPEVPVLKVIQRAKIVAVITGSTALDALIAKIPVIILGNSPFDYLPATMVRRVRDLFALPAEIAELLHTYQYSENALLNFIAAAIKSSVRVNLVTELLQKRGRYAGSSSTGTTDLASHPHVAALAEYLSGRVHETID